MPLTQTVIFGLLRFVTQESSPSQHLRRWKSLSKYWMDRTLSRDSAECSRTCVSGLPITGTGVARRGSRKDLFHWDRFWDEPFSNSFYNCPLPSWVSRPRILLLSALHLTPSYDLRAEEPRHFQVILKMLNLLKFFSLSWNILSFTFCVFGYDNLICNFNGCFENI